MQAFYGEKDMKKIVKKRLELSRETLQRLGDEALKQPAGGIFRQQTELQTYSCVCTFTCGCA
jgi:hypothetical protein